MRTSASVENASAAIGGGIPCTPAGVFADNYTEPCLGRAPVDSVVCRGVVAWMHLEPRQAGGPTQRILFTWAGAFVDTY